jgi:hypothetical protein
LERENPHRTAKKQPKGSPPHNWDAKIKAGHWRIIEKEIRALAGQLQANDA